VSATGTVVVVGGGVAGLVAATRLARAGVDVTLLERSERFGGNVRTIPFAGRALDMGAEMVVTRPADAVDLFDELGLGSEIVAPLAAPAHVLARGRLRPLPAGLMRGLPDGVGPLLRSGILTPRAVLRACADLWLPSRAPESDVAIGEIVRRRLGAQVLDHLVDPLLGGIHAGRCDELSAQALAPQALAALAGGRGLVRGLRAAARAGDATPGFVTLRNGLGALPAALAHTLLSGGSDVRLDTAVTAVGPGPDGGVELLTGDGATLHADACVIATPARHAGRMLGGWAPAAAAELARLRAASAAVIALAYPPAVLDALPRGTGFLTSGGNQRIVRACTWSSAKWAHLAGGPAIVKAFVGRAGEPPPAVADDQLANVVDAELAAQLNLPDVALQTRVERFPAAIPQYAVGHLARVARIEAALPERVELAGAAYRGAGVPACIRSGQAAADRLLGRLGMPSPIRTPESSS
jgi:oxygen-dependent protoporphyrinogen oxidase